MMRGYINDDTDHYPGIVCECNRGWLPYVVEDGECPSCKAPFTTDPTRAEAAAALSRLLKLKVRGNSGPEPELFEICRTVAQALDPDAKELDPKVVVNDDLDDLED